MEQFNELMQWPLWTIVYSILGFVLMWIFLWISGLLTKFSIKKEIVEDENVALWIMLGCWFIWVAIIIASSIVG